jgi:uncharacterized lipoprotein YmbA
MNHRTLYRTAFFAVGALLLTLVGCVGGTSKSSTFYLLRAMPGIETASRQAGGPVIVLGPVTVPAYLKRPQIATTADGHQLQVDQFNRWAEPLKESVERVLAENLSILLGTANVYRSPRTRRMAADYQVEITLSRFYADANGKAMLVAYWTVLGQDDRALVPRRRSAVTVQAPTQDLEAVVAAQNTALQTLSRQISTAIQNLR